MGCGQSSNGDRQKSKQIQNQLDEDGRKEHATIKLLLLGTGESGKSTFMKQLKILHANGFTAEEIYLYNEVLLENLAECANALLDAASHHEEVELKKESKEVLKEIRKSQPFDRINPEIGKLLQKFISDPGAKALCEFVPDELKGSILYFLEHSQRISAPGFKPTNPDLLRCRTRTSGIHEVKITIQDESFTVIDVGGQRTERRKWVHCFQDVTAIIFFVALSEYDMVLLEDAETNRMQESLQLFDEICNCEWLKNVPIIMFFNKTDLFEQKIKKTNITDAFPSYAGSQNFDEVVNYIQKQFLKQNQNSQKGVHPLLTCVTDTEQMSKIILTVHGIILEKHLNPPPILI